MDEAWAWMWRWWPPPNTTALRPDGRGAIGEGGYGMLEEWPIFRPPVPLHNPPAGARPFLPSLVPHLNCIPRSGQWGIRHPTTSSEKSPCVDPPAPAIISPLHTSQSRVGCSKPGHHVGGFRMGIAGMGCRWEVIP